MFITFIQKKTFINKLNKIGEDTLDDLYNKYQICSKYVRKNHKLCKINIY